MSKQVVKRVVVPDDIYEPCHCAHYVLEPDGDCLMEYGEPPYRLCDECSCHTAEQIMKGDILTFYSDGTVGHGKGAEA